MKDTIEIVEKSFLTSEGNKDNCLSFKCVCELAGLEELSQKETTSSIGTLMPASGGPDRKEARLQAKERQKQWFVMRDLKRHHAKLPAYKQLAKEYIEAFTPSKWHLIVKRGKKAREEIPFMQHLLFVHDTRENLNLIVGKTPTL